MRHNIRGFKPLSGLLNATKQRISCTSGGFAGEGASPVPGSTGADSLFFERHAGGERAVLVHPECLDDQQREDPGEFQELVRSANVENVAFVVVPGADRKSVV